MSDKPRVVILSGGKGTRIGDLTRDTPKPLLNVGSIPIIQHIINHYIKYGFNDFVIPVGYLADRMREYFAYKYLLIEDHWRGLHLSSVFSSRESKQTFTIIDTGLDTLTGGRLKRIEPFMDSKSGFCFTYGDGIADVDVENIYKSGISLNKNIITAVHPLPRFGSMIIDPEMRVVSFAEKAYDAHDWINGGFMYLKPDVFKYIQDDKTNFEKDVIPELVKEQEVYAVKHFGYWQCCDTLRDLEKLNEDHKNGIF